MLNGFSSKIDTEYSRREKHVMSLEDKEENIGLFAFYLLMSNFHIRRSLEI